MAYYVDATKRLRNEIADSIIAALGQYGAAETNNRESNVIYFNMSKKIPQKLISLTDEEMRNGTIGGGCLAEIPAKRYRITIEEYDLRSIRKKTLFINPSTSVCGNCKEGADPSEKSHVKVLGYNVPEGHVGCGVVWEYVSSEYLPLDVSDMRSDLKYIPPSEIW